MENYIFCKTVNEIINITEDWINDLDSIYEKFHEEVKNEINDYTGPINDNI